MITETIYTPAFYLRRLHELYCQALEEDQSVYIESYNQAIRFFNLGWDFLEKPKITLTPDGTYRIRWMNRDGYTMAMEFLDPEDIVLMREKNGFWLRSTLSIDWNSPDLTEISKAIGVHSFHETQ